jgi:GntR family transcriptional repressor for pyruvate dehydrogenase complex
LDKLDQSLRIPRERLYQYVANHIQDLIVAGELRTGDKLPPEPELCETYGVSRTVIREATKSLAERGLLSIEPGRGTFIATVSAQTFSDTFGLFVKTSEIPAANLIEIRELLEVKIAELAAVRANPEVLTHMNQAIEDMEEHLNSVEKFIHADHEFHMALARATRNEIFPALIDSLVDGLQHVRRASILDVPAGPMRAQGFHRRIFECVEKGDARGAAEVMQQHLQDTAARYRMHMENGDGLHKTE